MGSQYPPRRDRCGLGEKRFCHGFLSRVFWVRKSSPPEPLHHNPKYPPSDLPTFTPSETSESESHTLPTCSDWGTRTGLHGEHP
jgi:hypothetical protein